MTASNFDEESLGGNNVDMMRAIERLHDQYGFDFTSLGLTAFVGAPLKWIYSAGQTSERHRRIALAPGHGIGGIVLKAGKPMMFTDIDSELDPREYSSYPIVFAEDLRSFCALPLSNGQHVIAVVLCAFRDSKPANAKTFQRLINQEFASGFCGLSVITEGFMALEASGADNDESPNKETEGDANAFEPHFVRNDLSRIIAAQEDERRRISRELHDGVAQELLTVTFSLQRLADHVSADGQPILEEARDGINGVLDELHNISVLLRPSALDHLGFVPALRSQALLLEKTYGSAIAFEGDLEPGRFDHALETQAYRICQEAMTNACKYSGSDKITVTIEQASDWLHATVSDTGCGFDVDHPPIKGSGCGLLGMQERAAQVGATLTIESGPTGTTVTLVTPMYGNGKDAKEGQA